MSLDNLKNENISNFQDKGKVQKKHRKGSILIKLIIIFLIAFSFLFGEKIYDKIKKITADKVSYYIRF